MVIAVLIRMAAQVPFSPKPVGRAKTCASGIRTRMKEMMAKTINGLVSEHLRWVRVVQLFPAILFCFVKSGPA
jgi:hypothetical protein